MIWVSFIGLLSRNRADAACAFVFDPVFYFIAEISNQPLDRPSRRIAQCTDGVAFDLLCYIKKHIDLFDLGLAGGVRGVLRFFCCSNEPRVRKFSMKERMSPANVSLQPHAGLLENWWKNTRINTRTRTVQKNTRTRKRLFVNTRVFTTPGDETRVQNVG